MEPAWFVRFHLALFYRSESGLASANVKDEIEFICAPRDSKTLTV
jgi:hypothetical protein